MPTYEYACQKCGDRVEVFQSFTAKSLKTHAACGGRLQKVFHASGVVFKGSGFYSTDSKKPKKSKDSTAAPASASSNASDGSLKDVSDKPKEMVEKTKAAVAKDTAGTD